jgi:enterochelin esterase family protein
MDSHRASQPPAGPVFDDATVAFQVPDPDRELAGVRLYQEVRVPGDRLDFRYADGTWRLVLGRPAVARMEYLLELSHPGGGTELVPDPGNPRRVAGAFGDKSVVEFPGYAPPRWLAEPAEPGRSRDFEVPAGTLDAAVPVRLWSPAQVPDSEPVPLLLAHDGPEYDTLASLTHYLAAGVSGGWLPPLRAALLGPVHRDDWYSANPGYAAALHRDVVPALTGAAPTTARVGMGTSLGALAALHAHRRHPALFDALFLQSGSFFHPRFDAHERRFRCYERVVGFVREVLTTAPARPVPAVLTCGAIEENADNNRLMAKTLRRQGYQATLHETPDVHNFTGWRDVFDPHLTRLLQKVRT